MHIYFSGIGGTAIGPLALLAQQMGHTVSGSDKQESAYITYLRDHGVTDIHIGQDKDQIAQTHDESPIDWFVYSSAVIMEQPDSPELAFCSKQGIHTSKRDELVNKIVADSGQKLIAIAGTHGKTTTTAMTVWTLQQLGIPFSYMLAAKTTFADMAKFDASGQYFVYEADEYDRNFLAFQPALSLITGIDWDHPDIYPTQEEYNRAFQDFVGQSDVTYAWASDEEKLNGALVSGSVYLGDGDVQIDAIKLAGRVNRRDAWLVANALSRTTDTPLEALVPILEKFPGVSRRFEQIAPNLFSDYAHTPEKIRGALQLGHEVAGEQLVVVYEGLHNTRQHFIRDDLLHLFDSVKKLYIVPSYLAREDETLELLTPEKLRLLTSELTQAKTTASQLDDTLKDVVQYHISSGDTVLCLSAGGGNSLDEWLRKQFAA